jgi:hypothetical protein
VGIHFSFLKTSKRTERIALIGGVATQKSARGKGYSTTLMNEALKRIDEASCTWSLLWGSEHEFYRKFGFEPSGIQSRALIADLSLTPGGLGEMRVKTGFTDRILTELLNRTSGIQFTPEDRTWLIHQKSVKWFYLDAPFAFVGFERGMDLSNMVHEMGGDLRGIQKLLYFIFAQNPNAQVLGSASQLRSLGFDPDLCLEETLCLARPKVRGTPWDTEFFISGLGAC